MDCETRAAGLLTYDRLKKAILAIALTGSTIGLEGAIATRTVQRWREMPNYDVKPPAGQVGGFAIRGRLTRYPVLLRAVVWLGSTANQTY